MTNQSGGGASLPGVTSFGDGTLAVPVEFDAGTIVSPYGQATLNVTTNDATVIGEFSVFGNGNIVTGNPIGDTLDIVQHEPLTADSAANVLYVRRTAVEGAFHYTDSLMRISDGSTTGPASLICDDGATDRFTVSREGGIGMHGHAPQSAPRTLAQTTIDAITDANAKTAVQAVANALADMGALTIT